MQDIRDKYINDNGVIFELRAYNNDGETLISYTGDSFDDVSGYAFLADENFDKLVIESEEGRGDDLVNAEIDESLDARSY